MSSLAARRTSYHMALSLCSVLTSLSAQVLASLVTCTSVIELGLKVR